MTPKEKARELVWRYCPFFQADTDTRRWAKECALIVVDEILKDKHQCSCEQEVILEGWYQPYRTYWQLVKKEIEIY